VIDGISKRQFLLKQYSAAEASYQKALSIWPANKSGGASVIRNGSASIYHQLGAVAEKQRQWARARQYYLTALGTFVECNDSYSGGVVVGSLARLWQAGGDAGLPAAVAAVLGMSVEEAERGMRETLTPNPSPFRERGTAAPSPLRGEDWGEGGIA